MNNVAEANTSQVVTEMKELIVALRELSTIMKDIYSEQRKVSIENRKRMIGADLAVLVDFLYLNGQNVYLDAGVPEHIVKRSVEFGKEKVRP